MRTTHHLTRFQSQKKDETMTRSTTNYTLELCRRTVEMATEARPP